MADELTVVVLAAGKGTRMKSRVPKLLHPVCGTTILEWVLRVVRSLDPAQVVVVADDPDGAIAHTASVAGAEVALQRNPLGTGHALLQTKNLIRSAWMLVVPGDLPLLEQATLATLVDACLPETGHGGRDLTVATMQPD
ncbi:NTP transferase domain-containing protein, partial [Candidatus Bipolaricaulota bacterium]|nr:NTP transferase domain-containing protein [Candidatus Bipolaricaulota bacterium]